MSTNKKYAVAGTFILLIVASCVYFIYRNTIKNKIIIENQTEERTPEITFYLTASGTSDSEVIKGERLVRIIVASGGTETLESPVEIPTDSNVIFEYQDNNDNTIIEFLNDYIPQGSKRYESYLYVVEIDRDGILNTR